MPYRRHGVMVLLLLAIAFSFGTAAQAQQFTLEQVMSSPFPSELIVSQRGDKLAWAFDAEGKRNIWIAESPAFAARQLTRSNADDGQELTELVFSPNGGAIAYVRGQGKNQAGEVPNPTSDPAGARQQVMVVDTRTGRVTTLGDGSSPIFNAAGDQVIYLRDGKCGQHQSLAAKKKNSLKFEAVLIPPSGRRMVHNWHLFRTAGITALSAFTIRDQIESVSRLRAWTAMLRRGGRPTAGTSPSFAYSTSQTRSRWTASGCSRGQFLLPMTAGLANRSGGPAIRTAILIPVSAVMMPGSGPRMIGCCFLPKKMGGPISIQ